MPARRSLRGTQHYAAALSSRPVFFWQPVQNLIDFGLRMVKENGRRIPAGGRAGAHVSRWPDTWLSLTLAMPGATRTFRVPCRCSAVVTVGLGQAGSQTTCPACNATVDIPRLRELAAFEVSEQGPAARSWRASDAWMLVGVIVAIVATVAAGFFSSADGGASQRLPDERVIRAAVESADAATLHQAWLAVKRSGVNRGAVQEEVLVKQRVESYGRLALLLWCVAAVGLLAALAGGIAHLTRPLPAGMPKR